MSGPSEISVSSIMSIMKSIPKIPEETMDSSDDVKELSKSLCWIKASQVASKKKCLYLLKKNLNILYATENFMESIDVNKDITKL